MIIIKLSGGLGNNIFQYVAARSLSIHMEIPFSYYKVKGLNFYYKKIIRIFRKIFLNKEHFFEKQLSHNDLSDYFVLNQSFLEIFWYKIYWTLSKKKHRKYFQQKIKPTDYKFGENHIDESFFKISPNTKLSGPFASEKYFLVNRDVVLDWLQPKHKFKNQLDKLVSQYSQKAKDRCCIHVRRGDALFMDKGYDFKGLGWGLPLEYYRFVINILPKNLLFIFVSDDPEWVKDNFSFLDNKIIHTNNSEIIDLLMFTTCRYNVIARSTFSWWGAWLNKTRDKVVYAPKNFIGFHRDFCFPLGLDLGKEASNWNYISAKTLYKK